MNIGAGKSACIISTYRYVSACFSIESCILRFHYRELMVRCGPNTNNYHHLALPQFSVPISMIKLARVDRYVPSMGEILYTSNSMVEEVLSLNCDTQQPHTHFNNLNSLRTRYNLTILLG